MSTPQQIVSSDIADRARRPGIDLCTIEEARIADLCGLLSAAGSTLARIDARAPHPKILTGRTILNFFGEPSTRTRTSFELAGRALGAEVVNFVGAEASSIAKGETLRDTVEVLDAMGIDVMVVRDRAERLPDDMRGWIRARVVNAGDGTREHPTQALLDALTLIEAYERPVGPEALAGLRILIVGDVRHGRVGRSDARLFRRLGAEVVLAGPPELIDRSVGAELGAGVQHDFDRAIAGVDAVVMLRIQRERLREGLSPDPAQYHRAWGLTPERMATTAPRAIVLHPGPMNRGVEIAGAVADGPRARILRQVTCGIAVRMAVLTAACGVDLDPLRGRNP